MLKTIISAAKNYFLVKRILILFMHKINRLTVVKLASDYC